MSALPISILVAVLFVLIALVVAVVTVLQVRSMPRVSRVGAAVSVLPATVLLGLFYSLAVHMHHTLGGWPEVIGEHGFPPSLLTHAHVAIEFFSILVLATVFVWPVAYLVCVAVPSWRRVAPYLGMYALAFAVGIGMMLLAPAPFLNWWWD
jgi:hypothetical protein